MKVATVTAHARAICEPAGVQLRYEFDSAAFRWNFYRNGERVKTIAKLSAVIPAAQKVVDMGK